MNLANTSILITGAGSGIGRATAILLARRGARLTLLGRRRAALEETAALAGGAPLILAGDVADPALHDQAIAAAVARFGGLDVLVNNAGNVRAGRLEDMAPEDIRAMIEVNLIAPILLTRAALPALRQSGAGAVVLVASGMALLGAPYYGAYAAAKAGLGRFGESLRRELLDEGVHVMTLYPTATETPMMASNRAGPELGFVRESAEEVAAALVEGIEQGALEVIRGGEARRAMLAANRDQPGVVDARFRALKPQLLAAVSDHRAL